MKPNHIPSPRQQQGIALVIALIFLVVLTLLGVTVASNNTLQERMAGNTRNRDLAFQSAEFALQAADTTLNDTSSGIRTYIDAIISGTTLPSQPSGFLSNGETHDNGAAYWSKPGGCSAGATDCFHWNAAANAVTVAGLTNGLTASSPQYVVEQMPTANISGTTTYFFRITARGVGKSSDAVVILQTMYKFQ